MNRSMHRTAWMTFAALLSLTGPVAGPWTSTAKADVVPIDGYGASYGEWSARWWQWILSIPAATNPNFEGDCAQGQVDRVWFLASLFEAAAVTRHCTVPAHMPILVPVINAISFRPQGQATVLNLRQGAKDLIDAVDPASLLVTVDGEAVVIHRATSPTFTVVNPPKVILPRGWLTLPGNSDTLVSDGYWVLLEPLAPGSHEIRVKGEIYDLAYWVDVTYKLTVTP